MQQHREVSCVWLLMAAFIVLLFLSEFRNSCRRAEALSPLSFAFLWPRQALPLPAPLPAWVWGSAGSAWVLVWLLQCLFWFEWERAGVLARATWSVTGASPRRPHLSRICSPSPGASPDLEALFPSMGHQWESCFSFEPPRGPCTVGPSPLCLPLRGQSSPGRVRSRPLSLCCISVGWCLSRSHSQAERTWYSALHMLRAQKRLWPSGWESVGIDCKSRKPLGVVSVPMDHIERIIPSSKVFSGWWP